MPHICTWASYRTLLNCFYSNTIHSLKKYFLELRKENCKAQVKILDLSSKHIHITQQTLTWHVMLMARYTISCLSSKLWQLFGKTREVQMKSHPYKLVSFNCKYIKYMPMGTTNTYIRFPKAVLISNIPSHSSKETYTFQITHNNFLSEIT